MTAVSSVVEVVSESVPCNKGNVVGARPPPSPQAALSVDHIARTTDLAGATFEEHERSHAIGIWAGVGALTYAAGPVLSG
jgi:hypothetical protein